MTEYDEKFHRRIDTTAERSAALPVQSTPRDDRRQLVAVDRTSQRDRLASRGERAAELSVDPGQSGVVAVLPSIRWIIGWCGEWRFVGARRAGHDTDQVDVGDRRGLQRRGAGGVARTVQSVGGVHVPDDKLHPTGGAVPPVIRRPRGHPYVLTLATELWMRRPGRVPGVHRPGSVRRCIVGVRTRSSAPDGDG